MLTLKLRGIPAMAARTAFKLIVLLGLSVSGFGQIGGGGGGGIALRLATGSGVPSTGCTVAGNVGKVYLQINVAASTSPLYLCSKTGASSFGWVNSGTSSGGSGTVTSFAGSGPSWLTWTVSSPTTAVSASLAPTTAQTSHQVIGTCNAATTFAPCLLVAGDLPTTTVNSVVNDTNVTGSISGQALTLGWTGTLAAARLVNAGVFTGDATSTFPALTIGNAAITAVKMVNAGVFTGDATSTFPAITIGAGAITNSKIANTTIDLAAKVTGLLPAANVALNILDGSGNSCVDAGGSDTYACTLSPAIASYVTGGHYRFKANTANTGAATINLNAIGAKTIVKAAGGITTALADNDIRSGQWVDLVYDGTNMQMQSLLGNAAAGGTGCTSSGSNIIQKGDGAGGCSSSSATDNGTTFAVTEPITAPSVSTGTSPPATAWYTGTAGIDMFGDGTCTGTVPASVSAVCDKAGQPFWLTASTAQILTQGPSSTTSSDLACWNATDGSLLKDCTAIPSATTATTQSAGDNTTKVSTTAFVTTAVANAIAASNPATSVLAASTSSQTGTYSNGASGIGATFTITATGAYTLDGTSISTIGQRVLLKNQASAFQNGIYTATVVGTVAVSPVFTRALDYDQPSDINNTGAVFVQTGTANILTSWLLTSTVATMGTDALNYSQSSSNPSNLVTAVSPGVGLAHFAGSTQAVTSSAVTSADATGNTSGSGNFCLVTSCVMTTPNLGTPSAIILANATGLPIVGGGTGQTTKAAAFDALQPMTTAGDIIYGGASGTGTRLATGTAKQILVAGTTPAYITFPDFKYAPAANCVNAVAGSGWSTTSTTPTPTCRAGTNNKNGYLVWGASDIGSFDIAIPGDWDGTNINATMDVSSSDATNGHTIIMQLATACQKTDGSTTDDVAYNTAQSLSTVTLNGNANRSWQSNLSTLTVTGCAAGSVLRVKISRTTDTATNVGVWGVGLTFGRLLTLQAN